MRTLCVALLILLAAPVSGQERAPSEPQVSVGDEIIVRGRTRRTLRIEIERAENALFERFNALNSRAELDIVCNEHAPLGTKIAQRECLPKFAATAEARASQDIVLGLQGSPYAGNPQQHMAQMARKSKLLVEEMSRLAREDEQLRLALQRLAELKQADDARRERGAR